MAHAIYKKETKTPCPRCGAKEARISTYHFGATYNAECSECAYGFVHGCDEAMAMARLHGKYLEHVPAKQVTP